MVNEKHVRRKLARMLVDGSLVNGPNLYRYQKAKRELKKMEKRNRNVFNHYFSGVVRALDNFENAMRKLEFDF